MSKSNFLTDIKKIRDDARKNLDKGPVTENYGNNLKKILDALNAALATEIICTLRYKENYYKASAIGASIAATEFLEHSNQEAQHADLLAERMVQLGGDPDLSPDSLSSRSHADYVVCDTVAGMIKENLVAERIAIDSYRAMIRFIGDTDPTTRRILETILAVEEEHADDLLDLAAEYNVTLTSKP